MVSSNNIFNEIISRIKQKAKGTDIIYYKHMKGELHAHVKWVGLEDVKEAIQQLKQNYILIERQKLEDFRCFIRRKAEECLREMETEEGIVRACLEARLGAYDEITLKLMELLKE